MQLHGFEKAIVKYVLEHENVRWSQLMEDLVEKGAMAQGSLSKYLKTLQRHKIIEKDFDDEGHIVYRVPEKGKNELRELTKASLSSEERLKRWEAFTKRWLDASLDELIEIGEAVFKKRRQEFIEEEREARLEEQKEKERIIKRLKKERKI